MMHIAHKHAKASTFWKHKLGAVVVKGNRILSTGSNELRYTKELREPTLHAEAAAILKMLKSHRQHDLAGADLYVSRICPSGRVGLAKPCSNCMALIRSVGIKEVHYTTNSQTTESLKV